MGLNHPETIPPPHSMEELSSRKLVLGARKVRDCCPVRGSWSQRWSLSTVMSAHGPLYLSQLRAGICDPHWGAPAQNT